MRSTRSEGAGPASARDRSAKRWAASISVGSFRVTSACKGVFVRMRRIVQVSPEGASNVIIDG